jgi:hypothetical protein
MALRVNRPQATGIPESIFCAMEDLNKQHPNEWKEGWVASLLDGPANDEWALKLLCQDGCWERAALYGQANQHNSRSVCASLVGLRSRWNC